jgi:hypothetical protein
MKNTGLLERERKMANEADVKMHRILVVDDESSISEFRRVYVSLVLMFALQQMAQRRYG